MIESETFEIFKELKSLGNVTRTNYSGNQYYFAYIFLCGGNADNYTSRDTIKKILGRKHKYLICENLEDVRGDLDLLTFERILEALSKVILISLESFGTSCELGAFTYHTSANKELIIYDEKKKDDKSFINNGPISLIKSISEDRICYANFSKYKSGLSLDLGPSLFALKKHNLITYIPRMKNFYNVKSRVFEINNLDSFFCFLLDLASFIGYCDSRILIKYICIIYEVDTIHVNSPGFYDYENIPGLLNCFLRLMQRLNLFEKRGEFYFPLCDELRSYRKKISPGALLFKKDFLESEECTKLKFKFLIKRRKIYDIGR